ncbi:response regulator transcription factor [Sphingobium sp.]|uniref:response regulator transcription factor n=1 Tax=Sphingobium sp. TaxID=1912891 RepID=UPI0028BD167F|nr:response regulator transcription factor [Sphingobium sp.]
MIAHSVFLVDDHPVLLRGLADLVSMESDLRVIGSTTEGSKAFALLDRLKPDIAVLDINMPDVSGLAILRRIRSADLPVRVVFLTAMISPAQVSEAIANDVWGILLKEAAPDRLIDCLRSVAAGRRWFADEVAVMADILPPQNPSGELASLTPREMEIAGLACSGLSNKLIARQLGAGEGTVKIHLHNIFQKLRINNRTALAALYYRQPGTGEAPEHPRANGDSWKG